MALDFITNPGGAFPRFGRILRVAYLLDLFVDTLPAAFIAVLDQYETTLQQVGGAVSLQSNELSRVPSGVMGFAQQTAQDTVIEMVLVDVPSMSRSFPLAMREFVRQMVVQGVTVRANVITITPTALPTLIGNGVLVTSTKRGDGLVAENTVAEMLRLVCVSDSYSGGATQGRETFGLAGAPATARVWDHDYPGGSGAASAVQAISADTDGDGSANLLTNGDFEVWSADAAPVLSNWILLVGTWGTDVRRNTANVSRGTYCVEFVAGTGVNTSLYQLFDNVTTGTVAEPNAVASYATNVWLKRLGVITAGVLTVELVNSAGVVVNDAQGVANSTTITLSTLTTSYVAFNVVFRTPLNPPSPLWFRYRVSTALAGANFVMDDACFAPLSSMYVGGPGYVIFSGATPFVGVSDGWTVVNTNDQGGATNLATFQTGFDRLLDMDGLGLLLPSSGTPSVLNTLITV